MSTAWCIRFKKSKREAVAAFGTSDVVQIYIPKGRFKGSPPEIAELERTVQENLT